MKHGMQEMVTPHHIHLYDTDGNVSFIVHFTIPSLPSSEELLPLYGIRYVIDSSNNTIDSDSCTCLTKLGEWDVNPFLPEIRLTL